MAISTTTSYSDMILSEMLGDFHLAEARPPGVMTALVNKYDIAGQKTGTLKLNRWDDSGPAEALTEGTAYSTVTSLGSTAVSVSPSEGAVQQALISWDAIEERTGLVSIQEVWNQQGPEAVFNAVLPEAMQLGRAVGEKVESDLSALFASVSNSAGTTTTDMGLDDFDTALLGIESQDVPAIAGPVVACLDREQRGNLRTELMVTSGGVGGNIWNTDIASMSLANEAIHSSGLAGNLLGVDMYVLGIGARQTANAGADVTGCLFRRGSLDPEVSGMGEAGAFALVQGRPLLFSVDSSVQERGILIQANYKYAVAERVDLWAYAVITDAP